MKLTAKLLPLIYNALNSPKEVVLTLALTSLLCSGIGLGGNNSAAAFPGSENMSGERISQLSELQQSNRLPHAIALRILRDARQRSSVPIRELQITQVTPKTFSNPCIFKFGEICTREYNPIEGWEVVVQVQKQSWTYHVDRSGTQIVLDPKVSTSKSATLPEEIQDAILQDASDRSGVAIADLQITQVTEKTFSNPCVFKFGEICTSEYNPVKGWEVVVQVQEQAWIYHVDQSGSQIVLDPKVSQ